MIRWGLCCKFLEEPIRFRLTTATALLKRPPRERRRKLADLCLANAKALREALQFCVAHGIGCFRVNSQILPLKTHPEAGYELAKLPGGQAIIRQFKDCGRFARRHGLRTSFHPDPFILLNSPDPDIVRRSLADLRYHAEVAAWIGADVINIHGGGAYGDKPGALKRLALEIRRLPAPLRSRLTLENDDRVFTPDDLLPLCRDTGIPLVYDVHHHRCLPDRLSIEQASRAALGTWDREPLFHVSSPIHGWHGKTPSRHADMIHPADFPACWTPLDITVEVEAKSKEKAVLALMHAFTGLT
jgi:UV DNA damage endonuclease